MIKLISGKLAIQYNFYNILLNEDEELSPNMVLDYVFGDFDGDIIKCEFVGEPEVIEIDLQ